MEIKKLIVLFVINLIYFFLPTTTAQDYRLSKDIIPLAYNIQIKPYLLAEDGQNQFKFDGEVNITLKALASNLQSITLHKDYLEVSEAVLYASNNNVIENVQLSRLSYDSATDKLTVSLLSQLTQNVNYTLYLKYTGQIRSGLAGVFRASYDDGKSWYAITQLQRIDARTAFPCFDEPQLKATFEMHISRPRQYKSFFNTKISTVTPDGADRYIDHFEVTPLMSTYLVAFVIGDFEEIGNNDYKLILNSKVSNMSNYAYDVGLKTLDAYDKYTGLPYKTLGNSIMQKAGSIRFPHNGMENWGLVIYQDSVLTQEPGYTNDWSNKEYTVTILVHETAHMWFGNSVTFKWWSYFWLNEAFARYYQYFLAHEIYPEFELDKQFVVNQVHLMLNSDAVSSTQPMTSPEESINTPSQIASKFSGIAYAKGAAILRMWSNLMGKDNFDAAIRDYLKENHLKNTVPEDLFVHLRQHWPASHQVNVTEFLTSWTEQVGYPLLKVSYNQLGAYYTFEQQRFLLDPTDGSDPSITYIIPITYSMDSDKDFDNFTPLFYMNKTQKAVNVVEGETIRNWIIFNNQQSNYYRVKYDAYLLRNIRSAFMSAQHDGIPVLNRAQVVDDLFTFARIGDMDYDKVFDFMEYLTNELDYLAWHPAFAGFQTIYQRLTIEQHSKFGKLMGELLQNVYKKLGFNASSNESVLDGYNRNKVVSWLCRYHQTDCSTTAESMFTSLQAQNTKATPDFRETLYCAASRDGSHETYLKLKAMFEAETRSAERTKILKGMGCNINFVEEHYAFVLMNDVPQDMTAAGISAMYTETPENIDPVFSMINKTVEVLAEQLGSWSATASVISGIANYFTTQQQLNVYMEFIETKGHLFGASVTTLENALTNAEKNLDWSKKNLGSLMTYLDERYKDDGDDEDDGAAALSAISVAGSLLCVFLLRTFF